MSGSDAISYYKADITEFMDPNPDFRWVQMNPDLSIGKVKEHYKAGVISLKLSIHDKRHGPIVFKNFDSWTKDPPKRMNPKYVRAFVFQCRDLPAADSDGQSDPFIKIWDTTKDEVKTKVIEDNNNPLFYETLQLTFDTDKVKSMAPFILDIYDDDAIGADFIVRSVIYIHEASYIENSNVVPKPKWHKCSLKPGAPPQGEVLVSFAVCDLDYDFKIKVPKQVNLSAEVPRKEFMLDINILGLRNL